MTGLPGSDGVVPVVGSGGRTPVPVRNWLTGNWYFVVAVLTAGMFAWVPFLHAAIRLRNPRYRVFAAIYGAAAILLIVLTAVTPRDAAGRVPQNSAVGVISGLVVLAVVIGACVQLVGVRRAVRLGPPPEPEVNPVVAAALADRAKRADARALAERDPLLAREIHIGRPDLTRGYDDGGLVDLNSAPSAVIAQVCAIARVTAESIVAARPAGTGYLSVDDAFLAVDIPFTSWDRIRDHALVLPV
jgi:hypothetical protein